VPLALSVMLPIGTLLCVVGSARQVPGGSNVPRLSGL
jgi:hypothetical protein